MKNYQSSNIILEKSFAFALEIIEFSEELIERKRYRMADQLFRSGTSIGANLREAQNAESKKDFLHKVKIAAKEADETAYWLELCKASPHYPHEKKLQILLKEIQRILNSIISTIRRNSQL